MTLEETQPRVAQYSDLAVDQGSLRVLSLKDFEFVPSSLQGADGAASPEPVDNKSLESAIGYKGTLGEGGIITEQNLLSTLTTPTSGNLAPDLRSATIFNKSGEELVLGENFSVPKDFVATFDAGGNLNKMEEIAVFEANAARPLTLAEMSHNEVQNLLDTPDTVEDTTPDALQGQIDLAKADLDAVEADAFASKDLQDTSIFDSRIDLLETKLSNLNQRWSQELSNNGDLPGQSFWQKLKGVAYNRDDKIKDQRDVVAKDLQNQYKELYATTFTSQQLLSEKNKLDKLTVLTSQGAITQRRLRLEAMNDLLADSPAWQVMQLRDEVNRFASDYKFAIESGSEDSFYKNLPYMS